MINPVRSLMKRRSSKIASFRFPPLQFTAFREQRLYLFLQSRTFCASPFKPAALRQSVTASDFSLLTPCVSSLPSLLLLPLYTVSFAEMEAHMG